MNINEISSWHIRKSLLPNTVAFRFKEFFAINFRRIVHRLAPKYYPERIKKKVEPIQGQIKQNIDVIEKFAKKQSQVPALLAWKQAKIEEQNSLKQHLKLDFDIKELTLHFQLIKKVQEVCQMLSEKTLDKSYEEYARKFEDSQNQLRDLRTSGLLVTKKDAAQTLKHISEALLLGDSNALAAVQVLKEIGEEKRNIHQMIATYFGKSAISKTDLGDIYLKALEDIERQFLENLDVAELPKALHRVRVGRILNLHLIKREKIYEDFEKEMRNYLSSESQSKNAKAALEKFKKNIDELEAELEKENLVEDSKEWFEAKLQKEHLQAIYQDYKEMHKALLLDNGFEIVPTCANGSCLYDSLVKAIQYLKIPDQVQDREILRKNIAEYMEENPEHFEEKILMELTGEYYKGYESGYFSSYLPDTLIQAFKVTRKKDLENEKNYKKIKSGAERNEKQILKKLWDADDVEKHADFDKLSEEIKNPFLACWKKRQEIIESRKKWYQPYVKGMAVGRSYGGPVEVFTFHLMTKRPIRIYTSNDFKNYISYGEDEEHPYAKENTIHLLRLNNFPHYEYLNPNLD